MFTQPLPAASSRLALCLVRLSVTSIRESESNYLHHGLLPFGSTFLPGLDPEDEGAKTRRCNNVHRAVMVQIDRKNIRTCPGLIINQLRHKAGTARRLRIPHCLVGVQDRLAERVRVKESIDV